MRKTVLWGIAGTLFWGLSVLAVPCLRVEQLASGLPGLRSGQTVRQVLWIGQARLRLDQIPPGEEVPQPRYLLEADHTQPLIYELFPKKRAYRVWKELENLQADRDVYELLILKRSASLPPEERDRVRNTYYLREGLKREVTRTWGEEKTVELGGKAYRCRRLRVTENGRTILDALVTDTVGRGRNYYRFYRKLGVFSDQVLEALKEVSGLPLQAAVCVVTGKLKGYYVLHIKVVDLAEIEVGEDFFTVPASWTKEEKPLTVACGARDCANVVETANPTGGKYRYRGRWFYFCSKACQRRFIKELKALLRGKNPRRPAREGAKDRSR